MAKLEIQFPDATQDRILNALAKKFGYTPKVKEIDNPTKVIDNPETKAQFVRRTLASMVKSMVMDQEEIEASTNARNAQRAKSAKDIQVS